MRLRIAALALAVAFAAAPALGALASGCMPCGMDEAESSPCTSLSVGSCCGDVVPAAPVKTAVDGPTAQAMPILVSPAVPAAPELAPRTADALASVCSPLRLSVVRRL